MDMVPVAGKEGDKEVKKKRGLSLKVTGFIGLIGGFIFVVPLWVASYTSSCHEIFAFVCAFQWLLYIPVLMIGALPNIVGSAMDLIRKKEITDGEKILFYLNIALAIIWVLNIPK